MGFFDRFRPGPDDDKMQQRGDRGVVRSGNVTAEQVREGYMDASGAIRAEKRAKETGIDQRFVPVHEGSSILEKRIPVEDSIVQEMRERKCIAGLAERMQIPEEQIKNEIMPKLTSLEKEILNNIRSNDEVEAFIEQIALRIEKQKEASRQAGEQNM